MVVARKAVEALIGGRTWEELWPQVEEHLRRVLRFRLPPGVDRADVIQETATRLFASRGASFTTEEEVFQYATRIAMNLAIDLTRRSALLAFQPIVGDLPSPQDVEGEVVSRAELTAICHDAAAARIDLMDLATESDTSAASSALKSRRYRARKRLSRWSDRLAGGMLLPRLRWLLGGMAATASLAPAFIPGGLQAPFGVPDQSKQIAPATQRARPAAEPAEHVMVARPTAQATTRAAPTSPPTGPDAPVYRGAVDVSGPAWTGAGAGEREYPPEAQPEHLACARGISPLPDTCVPHPLR